jgi:hypothetical protein
LLKWQRTDLKTASRALGLPFATAAILLAVGIWTAVRDQARGDGWYGSLPWFVFALLLGVFALHMLVTTRRTPTRGIGIHQKGLIFQVGGQEPVALAWSEVDHVSRGETRVEMNGRYTHTNYFIVIRGAGQPIVLDNTFGAVLELTEEIAARSGKEMRQRLSAVIENGGTADFSHCGLTRRGVTVEGGFLPWSQIRDVRVRDGQVRITEVGQSKPWAAFRAGGFPNLAVFLALTHSLRTASRN